MKRYCYFFIHSMLLLLLFSLSFDVHAKDIIDDLFEHESQLENSIILGISDSGSNSTVYDVDLSLALNDLTQFMFYSEYNDINDSKFDFDSRTIDIGLRYLATESFSIALHYINSGQEQQLLSKTLRLNVSYYASRWDFSLAPEKSSIELANVSRTVTQTALGLNLNYYLTDPLVISVSFVQYQYDRNPQLVNGLFRRRIITIQTVSLANNYYDNYYTASLIYNFELVSNRYSYSQALSAIDNTISKTHSLDFVYSPMSTVSLYLTLGSNQQENLDGSQFYRLAVGYFW